MDSYHLQAGEKWLKVKMSSEIEVLANEAVSSLRPSKSIEKYSAAMIALRELVQFEKCDSLPRECASSIFQLNGWRKKKWKSSTLWARYSMIKLQLLIKHKIDIDAHNHHIKTSIDSYGNVTTYMDSYRVHKDIQTERFKPKRENSDRPTPAPQPRILLDTQTLTPLKHQIPFSLMAVPNDISRRNIPAPIQHIEIPEENQNEVMLKTRPKIYHSPQVSLDDVPDADMRKMLLDYTYTTELKNTNSDLWNLIGIEYREVPESVVQHDNFLTSSNKHYFSVYFKPKTLLEIKMNPEQNLRGQNWEKDKVVGIANNTEHFWKHNKPKYGSRSCDVLNLVETRTMDEIRNLVENERLDVQHDKTSPRYAGYKSSVAVGVDLSKKYIPHNHPLRSTYQETFSWKIDPNNSKTIS